MIKKIIWTFIVLCLVGIVAVVYQAFDIKLLIKIVKKILFIINMKNIILKIFLLLSY